jgi:short-subunit dehydrogenase
VGLSLEGRRAVLTGASGGIGNAIARALHGRGASLLISGRRADVLESLARELGERVEVVPADLARREDVTMLAERAQGVDVLVANAALPASGRYDSFSPEEIDRALDINLRAPIQLSRALAPQMADRGAGHLVYISSIAGKVAAGGSSIYSATKFGLRGFAFALRQDLHGSGVGVSCVFPGFISDAGMFADSGLAPPPGVGTSSPGQVADAVIRGIEHDRAELDVAPLFMRASARLAGVAPGVVAGITRRFGGDRYADELAEAQREKR